ncbi:TetR/AcrR family transcriptional regulator [Nocardia higoensis]|uniref:TetR/AcrR family transcriptional regulator n=1 Tax=Nocardia higoensis TaxID=228599 RepID=A0ABS0DGV9_9NOCA|nr:TetR family transcriptional regulator [Nocardia higoensis]MBF6357716.1 TetR/AcrR family transcriptional regulator [Nocardia higoensis]
MRPAEPGRRALLNAGRTLLAGSDLTKLSVSAVTAAAEMAKGSFYQHWRSREDYIRALHEAFHDELFDKVEQQLAGRPPGAERLATGLAAYLDGCLAEPATKALLVQARTEAGLGEQVGRRNEQAAQVLTADLAAVGWHHPEPLAVLLVAAIAETALIELADGRPRDDLRDAILRLATPARD